MDIKVRRMSLFVATILYLSSFYIFLTIVPDNARGAILYVGGAGPGNYSTIQSAINAAAWGDTVYVYSGNYSENVIFGALSLIGEDMNSTIILNGGIEVQGQDGIVDGFSFKAGYLYLWMARRCRVSNVTLMADGHVIMDDADDTVLENVNSSGNNRGVELTNSDRNYIANSTFNMNGVGVWISNSNGNIIQGNNISLNGQGMFLGLSPNHTITGNRIFENTNAGIEILYSDHQIIRYNNMTLNRDGLYAEYSDDIVFENNTVLSNQRDGVRLDISNFSRVSHNNFVQNGAGVTIDRGNQNEISNNTAVQNNDDGFTLVSEKNSSVLHNAASGNGVGIRILDTYHSLVAFNDLFSNTKGISTNVEYYATITDNNCSYSQGPSLMWEFKGSGIHFHTGIHSLLANNSVYSNDLYGIVVAWSDDTVVTNNSIMNGGNGSTGLEFTYSREIHAVNNTISGFTNGVNLTESNNVSLIRNNVSSNRDIGVFLEFSDFGNTIVYNSIAQNALGIALNESQDNKIHHNDIINNSVQALNSDLYQNDWDNGYPSGGNYWSDYAGNDVLSGPDQDQPGPDGIGDAPYPIQTNEEDSYPLMTPTVNLTMPPSAPLNLVASPGDQFVNLTWDPPVYDSGSPITNYKIYRGTAPGGEAFLVEIGNFLSHTDSGLTNDQTYYYRISAVNDAGEGVLSDEASATPSAGQTVPTEPQNLQAIPGNGTVDLVWSLPVSDGNSQIINYQIYRGLSSGGETPYVQIGNTTTFPDIGLQNGLTYYYQVSAINGVGEGPLSNEANATPRTYPGAPGMFKADLGGVGFGDIVLTWTPSSDDGGGQNSIISYEIFRNATYDSDCVGYQWLTSVPNGTTSYTDPLAGELDPSNYFYQVCALDRFGNSTCLDDQAGKFKRHLNKGTNMISLPLVVSVPDIEIVLQTLNYDRVWLYDAINQEWNSIDKSKPYPTGLMYVDSTVGLIVNVTRDSNLTIAGAVPSFTIISLEAGWNLVGFPSFNSSFAVSDLRAAIGATAVEGFDPMNPPYFLRTVSDGDILQTGMGYWIYCPIQAVWIVYIQ